MRTFQRPDLILQFYTCTLHIIKSCVYVRLIKERTRQQLRRPLYPVPNFIHLQADKIPGYETFKLDEYIRYGKFHERKLFSIFIQSKA